MRAWPAWLLLASLAACGGKPSLETCEQVADHMLDLMSDRVTGVGAPPAEANLGWRQGAVRDHLIDHCLDQTTRAHAECVLAAVDERGIAACAE